MRVGTFTKTYDSIDIDKCFELLQKDNIYDCQLNLVSAGLQSIPSTISEEDLNKIKFSAAKYNVNINVLSGTFNMIDPDSERLKENIKRFEILCKIANALNVKIISLCTGTKDKNDKWKWHEDNLKESSYKELLETTKHILVYARKYNIYLGCEIETGNIICNARIAKQYLDDINDEHLKIIMDGANLYYPKDIYNKKEILDEAFSLCGKDIISVHAKDFIVKDNKIEYVAPGKGEMDYKHYLSLLKAISYKGPIIVHGIKANEVGECKRYLEDIINGNV